MTKFIYALAVFLVVLITPPLWGYCYGIYHIIIASSQTKNAESLGIMASLGQQGDFFGGHLSAAVGIVTVCLVIFYNYRQGKSEDKYYRRKLIMDGIQIIAKFKQDNQTDQCFRLYEYFSRISTESNDDETYLLLNTIIEGEHRKIVESAIENNTQHTLNNYPYTCKFIKEVGGIIKNMHLKRKGILM